MPGLGTPLDDSPTLLLPRRVCSRFASKIKEAVLRGLGGNDTRGTAGDELGILYDDGAFKHEDRYAGDALYSNTLYLEFKKTDLAMYKEFYVSLLDTLVSSTIQISGDLGGTSGGRGRISGWLGSDL